MRSRRDRRRLALALCVLAVVGQATAGVIRTREGNPIGHVFLVLAAVYLAIAVVLYLRARRNDH